MGSIIVNNHFGYPIGEYKILVPDSYNHDIQIDQFIEKVRVQKDTYYYNTEFTSKNFCKTTTRLEPGQFYAVKIYPILSKVSSDDCIKFLHKQNALLVGGQGLTLFHELMFNEFPMDFWVISFDEFDENDLLWKDEFGNPFVPFIQHQQYEGKWWSYDLGYVKSEWHSGHCLLAFFNLV